MKPDFSNPDDDGIKMKLLENLMGEMDERAVRPLLNKKPAGPEGETKGPEQEPAKPPPLPGDDLDEDANMDPELKALIRAKRGG
jgi:hypothetical protein